MTTEAPMTFMDHMVELRARLIKAAMAVVVGAIIGFIFHEWTLDVLINPYQDAVEDGRLAFFRPTEAFTVSMKLSLFGGLVLASPVLIYQLWRFIGPALTRRERRYVLPLSAVLGVLFIGGIVLGYWALSRGLTFLVNFGSDQLEPTIRAEFYLSFAMRFILAFGIAFEFPVFLFAAAAAGMVSTERLRRGRRTALVIILVAAALITPSGDPLTLMLLSVPLYAMFELTILAIRFILRK